MRYLKNIHPEEILKEEFLEPMGNTREPGFHRQG